MKRDLEEQILGCAFSNRKLAMELVNSVNEDYFGPEKKPVFLGLQYYFNSPKIRDIPSRAMLVEYFSKNVPDGDSTANYTTNTIQIYNRIIEQEVKENEFGWMLDKLRYHRNYNIQIDICKRLQESLKKPYGSEQVDEVNQSIKESVVAIDSIHRQVTYKEGTLKDSVEDRLNHYQYIKDNPDAAQGVLTGFTSFDLKTNGLHPGEFMIIAGDTGTGKSILMHNIAVNAYLANNDPFDAMKNWDATKGKNILYFSLEMPKESMERRIDACISGIYSNHIRDGLLSEDDERKYFRGLNFQSQYEKHFHIVDVPKGATTREIELKYIEVCESGWKPDLVVVDYMGIMTANNSSGSDWMDLGIISAELHEFARVYEIAVITGSQVNRTKDGTERYDTDRIARSSMIPHNADVVLQIAKRPDEYVRSDVRIHIIKLRDGDKGEPFTLSKDFERMKVRDIVDEPLLDDDEDFV